ncbi:hypothetical protein BRC84_01505 [Halobacteriales archaeon QS_1_68_44]|nr:MAG: hypothetical protein BRC84_01505 [Halobacteriales archaeon QS_1_68_44]
MPAPSGRPSTARRASSTTMSPSPTGPSTRTFTSSRRRPPRRCSSCGEPTRWWSGRRSGGWPTGAWRCRLGVELVEIGEYDPAARGPEALLTDRQLEVLDAAIGVGYYEEPREGTQADVAERVDIAPATVGEHLRRVEGTVLRALRE